MTVFLTSNAVEYITTNTAANIAGGARFDSTIGANFASMTFISAAEFIWMTFDETSPKDRKNVTRVSLLIRDMDEIAYTIKHKSQSTAEIHVGAKYIGEYRGNVRKEFVDIIYHEMTHVWQWLRKDRTPRELSEGIADFVRLRAGHAPGHWAKAGEGNRWDQGYAVTARFWEYCNGLRCGFMAEVNKKMRTNYSVNYFDDLLGKNVDKLWKDYKASSTTH